MEFARNLSEFYEEAAIESEAVNPHFKSVMRDTGKALPLTDKLVVELSSLRILGFLILENLRDLGTYLEGALAIKLKIIIIF